MRIPSSKSGSQIGCIEADIEPEKPTYRELAANWYAVIGDSLDLRDSISCMIGSLS